jgi:hypothetical protein
LLYFAKSVADRDTYYAAQEKGEVIKRYCADLCGRVMIAPTVEKHAGGVSYRAREDVECMKIPVSQLERVQGHSDVAVHGEAHRSIVI